MLNNINEPIQILEEGDMNLDFSKKIHVRKQKVLLGHQAGWIRVTKDWWRICIHNNIDFFTVEGDGLIAYDITKDLIDKDFLIRTDNPYLGTIYYIKNYLFHKQIHQFSNMSEYLNHLDSCSQQENHGATSEGGMLEIMKLARNIGQISNVHKCLQDCGVEELKRFINENPIEHPFANEFLNYLK
jgi:hypothetical protein